MSTPTAGPDDRSPPMEYDHQFAAIAKIISDEGLTHTADLARIIFAEVLSALRSARRDAEALRGFVQRVADGAFDGAEDVQRAAEYALDQLASPPILEKNDRG